MRYMVTLSYDGSKFCGWQIQPNSPSVQACLEDALGKLLGQATPVTGAGRTDTAVNAIGYVAHFDTAASLDCDDFSYKLNAILPHGISVSSLREAADDFHARFGATRREYTYFIHRHKDPFAGHYSYRCTWDLDFDAMNKAAALLTGRHDFSCFEKTGGDNKTSVCTVFEAHWSAYTPSHVAIMGAPSKEGGYMYFRISADRFLRNMVRALVGTLIDVGRGRRSVEEFAALILPPDTPATDGQARRCMAGESVPGHALFLNKVEY